ncbi:hypothetical protein CYMTET_43762 [Cymbomonas tetramitiformis]|uniref:Kinesin motor domain-containing protein n=1 Tax=Cymbomonas tetramitiformis TaxID=36881 RepID=A0AAE0F1C1_9CHLO|nr:hypothetical protein CYMTET_43762 [Cymbomonas tetramitiformis]
MREVSETDGMLEGTEVAPAEIAKPYGEDGEEWEDGEEDELLDLCPRNLASVFSSTPILPKKRKLHSVQEVAKSFAASSRFGPLLTEKDEVVLEKMQVACRIRPALTSTKSSTESVDAIECLHAISSSTIVIAAPEGSLGYKNGERGSSYSFSRVFAPQTEQEEFFQDTAAPLVRSVLKREKHKAVIMTYGITSAGKTYTMEGTSSEPGVIVRSLRMLYEGLEMEGVPMDVRVSLYEVYNEQIFDLLAIQNDVGKLNAKEHARPVLRLKDIGGKVTVAGLTKVVVRCASEAEEAYRRGTTNRRQASTALNNHSSRSHCIFTVDLTPIAATDVASTSEARVEEPDSRGACLSFVDLAGSERAGRTGNTGARMKESAAINSSLTILGRCLKALRWNQQHKESEPRLLPYRESKVTHIFRDVLHGWGKILLVVNVSPVSCDYDETVNVLKYAAIASTINTVAKLNTIPVDSIPVLPTALPATARKAKLQRCVSTASVAARAEDMWLEERATLQAEMKVMQERVFQAETKCMELETEIREEVSQEMSELLRKMEMNYKNRIANEVAACEDKYERKLMIISRDEELPGDAQAPDKRVVELLRDRVPRSGGGASTRIEAGPATCGGSLAGTTPSTGNTLIAVNYYSSEPSSSGYDAAMQGERQITPTELAMGSDSMTGDTGRLEEGRGGIEACERCTELEAMMETEMIQSGEAQAQLAQAELREMQLSAELQANAEQLQVEMEAVGALEELVQRLEDERDSARSTANTCQEMMVKMEGELAELAELHRSLEAHQQAAEAAERTKEALLRDLAEERGKVAELREAWDVVERERASAVVLLEETQAAVAVLQTERDNAKELAESAQSELAVILVARQVQTPPSQWRTNPDAGLSPTRVRSSMLRGMSEVLGSAAYAKHSAAEFASERTKYTEASLEQERDVAAGLIEEGDAPLLATSPENDLVGGLAIASRAAGTHDCADAIRDGMEEDFVVIGMSPPGDTEAAAAERDDPEISSPADFNTISADAAEANPSRGTSRRAPVDKEVGRLEVNLCVAEEASTDASRGIAEVGPGPSTNRQTRRAGRPTRMKRSLSPTPSAGAVQAAKNEAHGAALLGAKTRRKQRKRTVDSSTSSGEATRDPEPEATKPIEAQAAPVEQQSQGKPAASKAHGLVAARVRMLQEAAEAASAPSPAPLWRGNRKKGANVEPAEKDKGSDEGKENSPINSPIAGAKRATRGGRKAFGLVKEDKVQLEVQKVGNQAESGNCVARRTRAATRMRCYE